MSAILPPIDARGFAVLAFLEEVAAAPTLIGVFADALLPDLDATLVLLQGRGDASPEAVAGDAIERAALPPGVDPDVLLLAVLPELETQLAARMSAVLTREPARPAFAGLPHVDETRGAELTARRDARRNGVARVAHQLVDGDAVSCEPDFGRFVRAAIRTQPC